MDKQLDKTIKDAVKAVERLEKRIVYKAEDTRSLPGFESYSREN
jgi:hypothetical protein